MTRRFFRLGSLVAFAIFFPDTSLRAQDVVHPDSEFGPYVHQATLTLSNDAKDDAFARRMALVDDLALVSGTRSIYVFERDPDTDTWQEVEPIRPPGEFEDFGQSFAFDRKTVIVGSRGAAHLFRRDKRGRWRETATLLPSDGNEHFGASVDIEGDQAIVGGPAPFRFGQDVPAIGKAYVFRRVQEDSPGWTEVAILMSPSSPGSGGVFGAIVGVSKEAAIVSENIGHNTFANIFSRDVGGRDGWGLVRRTSSGFTVGGDCGYRQKYGGSGMGRDLGSRDDFSERQWRTGRVGH
jgi:hypothetical protein